MLLKTEFSRALSAAYVQEAAIGESPLRSAGLKILRHLQTFAAFG